MKKNLLASLLALSFLPALLAQNVDEEKLKKLLDLPQEEFKEAKKSLSKEEVAKLTELRKASRGGKAAPAGNEEAASGDNDEDAPKKPAKGGKGGKAQVKGEP